MRCPFCNHEEDKVIDSRGNKDSSSIRRRRECLSCGKRFTTFEYTERLPIQVVKKDGSREDFDRQKILQGLRIACRKRPVSLEQIEELVDAVIDSFAQKGLREVQSRRVGEAIVKKLKNLDEVAYVRFASVYRQFRDIEEFKREIDVMTHK